jgi:GAF domain-containing protein
MLAHFEQGVQNESLLGSRWPLEGNDVSSIVSRTGRAARWYRRNKPIGALSELSVGQGFHCGVGIPLVVNGRLWGCAAVGSLNPEPLPPDTEARISDFADLVSTALANAATRDELIASRARIVAAADDARRRLERDLHDGAQQRLVSQV